MEFYKPMHFMTQELVDPVTFSGRGERSLELMDAGLLILLDTIRDLFGRPITINTWHLPGGRFEERGFRRPDSKIGAVLSQHRFGRAADFDVKGLSADQARSQLQEWAQTHEVVRSLACIEMKTNWVHIDVRNTPPPRPLLIYP